jgi:hypothetical protein
VNIEANEPDVRAELDALKSAVVSLSQKLASTGPRHPIINGAHDVFKIVAELETAGWQNAKKVKVK